MKTSTCIYFFSSFSKHATFGIQMSRGYGPFMAHTKINFHWHLEKRNWAELVKRCVEKKIGMLHFLCFCNTSSAKFEYFPGNLLITSIGDCLPELQQLPKISRAGMITDPYSAFCIVFTSRLFCQLRPAVLSEYFSPWLHLLCPDGPENTFGDVAHETL